MTEQGEQGEIHPSAESVMASIDALAELGRGIKARLLRPVAFGAVDPAAAKLAAKMARAIGLMGRVRKEGYNDAQRYAYARDAEIMEEVRAALAEVQVGFFPSLAHHETQIIPGKVDNYGKQRNDQTLTRVWLDVTFVDGEGGGTATSTWYGESLDVGDKGTYKAITGALKYCFMKTFLVSTEDADPEQATDQEQADAAAARNRREEGRQQQPPRQDKPQPPAQPAPPAAATEPTAPAQDQPAGDKADEKKGKGGPQRKNQPSQPKPGGATKEQRLAIVDLAGQIHISTDAMKGLLQERYKVDSTADLTEAQANELVAVMKAKLGTLPGPNEPTAEEKAKAAEVPTDPTCADCGALIEPAVATYSKQRFGRNLCRNCQIPEREKQPVPPSAIEQAAKQGGER